MYSYSVNNHKLSIENFFSDYQLYTQITTMWAKILHFSCSLCRVISNWCLCISKSFVHYTKSTKTAKDFSLKVSLLIIYGRSGSRVYKGAQQDLSSLLLWGIAKIYTLIVYEAHKHAKYTNSRGSGGMPQETYEKLHPLGLNMGAF